MKDFEALYSKAAEAGFAAAKATVPPVMVVRDADLFGNPIPGGARYEVPSGPCGFAWVTLRPANSAFANWLKKNGLGKKDSYAGGLKIWVSEFGQSMVKKEAYASAFAEVLRDAGLRAYSDSRMD